MPIAVSTRLLRRELAFLQAVCRNAIATFIVQPATIIENSKILEPAKLEVQVQTSGAFARTVVPLLTSDATGFHFFANTATLLEMLTQIPDKAIELMHSPAEVTFTHESGNYTLNAQAPFGCAPIRPRRRTDVSSAQLRSLLEKLKPFYSARDANTFPGAAIEIAKNSMCAWWASPHQIVEVTASANSRRAETIFIPREYINAVLSLSPLPDDTVSITSTNERVFFSRFPREFNYKADKPVVLTEPFFPPALVHCATIHDIEEFNSAIAAAKVFTKHCLLPFVTVSTSENAVNVSATVRVNDEGKAFTVSDATEEDECYESAMDATVAQQYTFKAREWQLRGLATSGELHVYSCDKGTVLKAENVTSLIANMKAPEQC